MKKILAIGLLTIVVGACNKADDYYHLGIDAFNAKNYEKAIVYFDSTLMLDQNNASAFINRANAKYELNDFENSLTDFAKGIEMWPKDESNRKELAMIYSERADAYYELKKYDQAIEDYSEAITKDATLISAYIGRGDAYIKKQIPDLAKADY